MCTECVCIYIHNYIYIYIYIYIYLYDLNYIDNCICAIAQLRTVPTRISV